MDITKKYLDNLTYQVIGCAIEVHKHLGPGLLESVYQQCLERELEFKDINFTRQHSVPINYKGIKLNADLRLDLLVENVLCIELKSQQSILPVHESVLLTYMRLLEKPKGLIINFQCVNIFKQGQITRVNSLFQQLPDE